MKRSASDAELVRTFALQDRSQPSMWKDMKFTEPFKEEYHEKKY
jgi:hypothetical protein